uniref:UDP-glucuronosyltransferase n=1 Tax=Diabrotica virgifera virgifera TaxID=50390 RepID=A0A6P7G6G8_DIAVI
MLINVNFVIFFFCEVVLSVNAAKILILFNHFGKSHYFQGKALGHGLARAGHEVTMVSVFQDNKKVKGYKEIYLDGILESLGMETNFVKVPKMSSMRMLAMFHPYSLNYTESTLQHPKLQALMKSDETFDVIILEELTNAALKALSWHFKAPLILFCPFAPHTPVHILAGNSAPPAYVANTFLGYTHFMTFWERSVNTFTYIFEMLFYHWVTTPAQEDLMKKYFPDSPDLADIDKNVSLFLINDHESINSPIPHVPNMINILGFHLQDKTELPTDLKEYMDAAKDGAILFSFGSFIHPSEMDPKIKQAIIKSLGKLKQKVLWKTDEENFTGKPANMKLSKWVPQEAILAHPNCKLFITHGGFLSTIETIYHGVPILAVPFIGDQDLNSGRMVELGVGLKTEFSEITEEKLDYLLSQLLNNKKYSQNAKKRSNLIRDRPVKPIDLAVYWVEYVIRNKDLSHMRVAALELRWYQYLLLDVILVWGLGALVVIFILLLFIYSLYYYTVYSILKSLFCKKEKVKTN